MAVSSRATQFSQMHKVLKKHYKSIPCNAERSVLEQILFACLAENAHYDVAEEAYAAVVEIYYDWNEVRVTTIRELSESMPRLPDPPAAANRMRRVLQHVFENGYVFDLEHLRKQNLGPTIADLQKIDGVTPFVVSYVVQSALGGHSIPLDAGALQVLQILELATDKEVEEASISGLERAIPKNKGVEFGSLLHELAADFIENPFAAALKKILLQINPDAKDRLPKRGGKKKAPPAPEKPAKKKAAEAKEEDVVSEKTTTPAKKAPLKKAAKRKIVPTKKKVQTPEKKAAKKATQKVAPKKAAPQKKAAKKTPAKKVATKKAPAKKTVKKTAPTKKTKAVKKTTKKAAAKKSSKGIAKRKPR